MSYYHGDGGPPQPQQQQYRRQQQQQHQQQRTPQQRAHSLRQPAQTLQPPQTQQPYAVPRSSAPRQSLLDEDESTASSFGRGYYPNHSDPMRVFQNSSRPPPARDIPTGFATPVDDDGSSLVQVPVQPVIPVAGARVMRSDDVPEAVLSGSYDSSADAAPFARVTTLEGRTPAATRVARLGRNVSTGTNATPATAAASVPTLGGQGVAVGLSLPAVGLPVVDDDHNTHNTPTRRPGVPRRMDSASHHHQQHQSIMFQQSADEGVRQMARDSMRARQPAQLPPASHQQQHRRHNLQPVEVPVPPCPIPATEPAVYGTKPNHKRWRKKVEQGRTADLVTGIMVEHTNHRSPYVPSDHLLVVCENCHKECMVPKTAIMSQCPMCFAVSPATSLAAR